MQDLDVLISLPAGQVCGQARPVAAQRAAPLLGGLDPHLEHDARLEGLAVPRRADVPEMPSLIGLPFDLSPESAVSPARFSGRLPVNYWLPPSADERRPGSTSATRCCSDGGRVPEFDWISTTTTSTTAVDEPVPALGLVRMLCATWAITGSMSTLGSSGLPIAPASLSGTPSVGDRGSGRCRRGHVAGDGRGWNRRPPSPNGSRRRA